MRKILTIILSFIILNNTFSQSIYTGKTIGKPTIKLNKTSLEIKNNSLKAKWQINNKVLYLQFFQNNETAQRIDWKDTPWFYVLLNNGERLISTDFKLIMLPTVSFKSGQVNAIRKSDRSDAKCVSADFYNQKWGLKIHWEALLADKSNYIKQNFTLTPSNTLLVTKIALIELPDKSGITCVGAVAGSPLAGKNFFFALEHPMSQIDTTGHSLVSFMARYKPLTAQSPLTYSTVWGVSPKNQLRRSFLYYTERERAVPYHQQLHYNSWFDISWEDKKLNEAVCLDRVKTFADSLIVKRRIKMDAFLFDDGWDNNQTLWQFNSGFSNGFSKLSEVTKHYQADLGVWISPWGGYDEAKIQRLEYGQKQNPPFEVNDNGFSLSGSNYYKRFYDVVSGFVDHQGVSMFKFDGVGAGDGSEGANVNYEKDIDALLKLIPDLRKIKPDLFISLTVGTWPSSYWLNFGDAIWRNGWDTGLAGTGSKRQQWINFRDGETYKNIVKRAPLYPLNSIMYHGICIADNGTPDSLEMSDKSIADEIWSFFGTGTNLQELYVNPHKLNKTNWDCLAKAINWAKENENIMADTHWIGGSPAEGQIYGFASWSPKKAIVMLRNPSAQKQFFTIETSKVFELPENAKTAYVFYNARSENNIQPLGKGSSFSVALNPFEVLVLNAVPIK